MSRQDKSTSERHTKTLRELVKKSENKVCADCKRNDPRWASWNLGVFLCIRCSGVHRSMGTHISKVKSVDLDIWTPQQMESIQKWGNTRANLYWEAHLKPGHMPAEHKMESFIRSKYESRRWALDGPPPRDPSVLEDGREHDSEPVSSSPPSNQAVGRQPQTTARHPQQPPVLPSSRSRTNNSEIQQPQQRPNDVTTPSAPAPQDDLFSLDFHASEHPSTSPAPTAGPKRDVKNDILSLFGTPATSGTGVMAGSTFGAAQTVTPTQSMAAAPGTGIWGSQSGWNSAQAIQPSQGNVWAQQQRGPSNNIWSQQQQTQQQFGSLSGSGQFSQGFALPTAQNVWEPSAAAPTSGSNGVDLFKIQSSGLPTSQSTKKDDAFGDLWGGFK